MAHVKIQTGFKIATEMGKTRGFDHLLANSPTPVHGLRLRLANNEIKTGYSTRTVRTDLAESQPGTFHPRS
jgi:hypothetical protein